MTKKDSLNKFIEENNLDTLIFSNPKSIEYLIDFKCEPHERILYYVYNKNKEILLCPALEENSTKLLNKKIEVILYTDIENPYEKLKNSINKIDKVGIEKNNITLKKFEDLNKTFSFISNIDTTSLINNMRKIKNKDEIEKMRKAAYYADKCIEIAKNNLKVGITELELKNIIEKEISKFGINKMSFETMVLFGENAANPHGMTGNRKLKENEYVLLDLGCFYEGYASDITRVLEFGKVSEDKRKIYEIVLKANIEAIKAVKPGITFAEIDKIARDIISNEGYGKYFNHRLGHGLGMDVHEYPDVSGSNNDILEEGMTFTIEPGIYLIDEVGIRIEDDILVTKDGCEILTKYEK